MSKHTAVVSADSRSLWNVSLSPGWTVAEAETLRILLMYYGVGQWTKITRSGRLPGKTQAQIFLQTQRMLGQQSLAEFKGLHLRIDDIAAANKTKEGVRKNGGILINTGNNATAAEIKRKMEENRRLYELTAEELAAIRLPPRPVDPVAERQQQMARLHRLKELLQFAQGRLAVYERRGAGRVGDVDMGSRLDETHKDQALKEQQQQQQQLHNTGSSSANESADHAAIAVSAITPAVDDAVLAALLQQEEDAVMGNGGWSDDGGDDDDGDDEYGKKRASGTKRRAAAGGRKPARRGKQSQAKKGRS